MDLDPDLVFTQLANRLREIDLALVYFNPQLLELALDIACRDGAVQLLLFADFHFEGELDVGQARGFGLRRCLLGRMLLHQAFAFVGDPFLVRLRRRIGEPLGQKVVAGIAVLHLHDLTDLAQMLHVRPQNDFHRVSPQVVLDRCRSRASARRRRYWYHVSVMPSVQSPGSTNTSGTASAADAAAMRTSASAEMPNASANVATIAAPRSTYSVLATSPRFVPATSSTLDTGRINTPSQAT